MPDLKLDQKSRGSIRLMALDTSTLFLPVGSPVADYLQGLVGNQNGTRALLKPSPIDFAPKIRWTQSTASVLCTTGFCEPVQKVAPPPAQTVPHPSKPPPNQPSSPPVPRFPPLSHPRP